jgi:hypothetical protein
MKKWGIRIAAALGVLFLILLILPFAFKGKILTSIKESTNNSVNAKITFDDDISLSLIRNFPNISVGINNLKVVGIDSFAKDTLFATDKMRLTIDIQSVLGSGKPMTINKIYLNNPLINIIFLESGRANFDIAKVDSTATIDTAKSEPMNLQLESIVVENARIGYVDHSMDFNMFSFSMANALYFAGIFVCNSAKRYGLSMFICLFISRKSFMICICSALDNFLLK